MKYCFGIIYNINDEKYLKGCITSLPIDINKIILSYNKNNEANGAINQISDNNFNLFWNNLNKDEFNWIGSNFSLSTARNAVLRIAEKQGYDYVFFIDPDERLFLEDGDFEGFNEKIGAGIVNIAGQIDQQLSLNAAVIRIVSTKLTYRYRVHESIEEDLISKNLKFVKTKIILRHLGYEDEIIRTKKQFRNLGLIALDVLENPSVAKKKVELYSSLRDLKNNKQFIIKNFDYQKLIDAIEGTGFLNANGIACEMNIEKILNDVLSDCSFIMQNPYEQYYLERCFHSCCILKSVLKFEGIGEKL